jgi:hypothetical protein
MGRACPASLFELHRIGCLILQRRLWFRRIKYPILRSSKSEAGQARPIRPLRFLQTLAHKTKSRRS